MQSEALATASHSAFRVLAILLVGKPRERNGTMMCSESYARTYGLTSHATLQRALKELQDRGLIVCTRRVQRLKRFAALYAVTWWPIYNRDGQPLDQPEPASFAYANWKADAPITPAVGVNGRTNGNVCSPLPRGDHTPMARVTEASHHPHLTPKSAVHHPHGEGNSKSLDGGSARPPPVAVNVDSISAPITKSRSRGRVAPKIAANREAA